MVAKKKADLRDSMPWGYYTVTKGRLKGQVVYYDGDDKGKCIVYPESFLEGGYYLVPPSYLREATAEEMANKTIAGDELWRSGRMGILREILIEDFRMAKASEQAAGEGDIVKDVRAAFEAVMQAETPAARRAALLCAGVLTVTWIELLDLESAAVAAE